MMLQIRTLLISFLIVVTIYTLLNLFWSHDMIKKLALFFLAVHLADIFIKFIWNTLPSQLLHDIAEKSVFITGCDSGFGNKLARELDLKGVKVFAGCLFSEGLGASNLKKDCSKNLHVVQIDVTKGEQVSAAVKYVKNNLNDEPLHALVNNAGVFTASEVEFMKIEELQNVLEVNCTGVHRVTKEFLPLLRESKGRIVITASLSSSECLPFLSAYAMSKHAVLSYANCIRRELMKWSVSVHTIEPGIYNTEMKNMEVILSKLDDGFNHAPEETRQAYGGEAYRKLYLTSFESIDFLESKRIEDVTDCMIDAIAGKYPKSRYHPGLKGRLHFWTATNLPQEVNDIAIHLFFRIILKFLVFDQYQKARMNFVHTMADLASRPQNIEYLNDVGALDLLRPLLSDVVPTIQHTAAVALGRMANHDSKIAQAIVSRDILPQLLQSINKQNKFYKKAALFALRAISKHSPEMAQVVVQSGGLEAMVVCLEDFDPGVKEAAAWALGYVGRHNRSLAQNVVDAGAVPILVLCLREPELCLKQIAASALHDISKHSIELAQTVVDAGSIDFLVKCISNPDRKLKRQALAALSSIAKHSVEHAEMVVEAKIFPDILLELADPDDEVKRNAANLVKEITKQSLELSQLVVNTGGIGALIELIASTRGSIRLPAIMALGHIAAASEEFAMAIIGSKGVTELALVLDIETEEHVTVTAIWALGHIGKHTPEHAKALALTNVFSKIIQLYTEPGRSEDLQQKAKSTLKQVLQKCMHMAALEPLLETAPPYILKYIVGQFSKILPNDPKTRRAFVTSGGLKKLQEIKAEPGTTLMEYITIINSCYPEELINYYSPGYPDSLLKRVEQYQPQIRTMFTMSETSENGAAEIDTDLSATPHLHHGAGTD